MVCFAVFCYTVFYYVIFAVFSLAKMLPYSGIQGPGSLCVMRHLQIRTLFSFLITSGSVHVATPVLNNGKITIPLLLLHEHTCFRREIATECAQMVRHFFFCFCIAITPSF